ncbi:MAG TPA: ribonuclease HI family protein [Acidimicrobiia bacterium]|jgi:ribonuclease HI
MTLFDVDAGDRDPHSEYEVLEVFSDGGARGNPGPAAIGAVVFDPRSTPPRVLAEVSERIGVATNNVAEYRALLAGLDAAARFGARRLLVRADSKLLIEQLKGNYKVKHPNLKPLAIEARRKLAAWPSVELRHVPREQNTAADALVNRALDAPDAAVGEP